jgi:hypothetical protein
VQRRFFSFLFCENEYHCWVKKWQWTLRPTLSITSNESPFELTVIAYSTAINNQIKKYFVLFCNLGPIIAVVIL